MKLSKSTIEQRLASWPVARLGTTNASGQPHVVPIVFAWQSQMLWSAIDGKAKTGATLTRIKNVKVNPAASILLDDYDNDWHQIVDIVGQQLCPRREVHSTQNISFVVKKINYLLLFRSANRSCALFRHFAFVFTLLAF